MPEEKQKANILIILLLGVVGFAGGLLFLAASVILFAALGFLSL